MAAGLVDDAELRRGHARPRELAVVGVPLARRVADPAHARRRRQHSLLDVLARGATRSSAGRTAFRARPRRARARGGRPASRFVALQPRDQRARPEVVRRPGVRPLLGAGRDQPHVARGRRPGGQRAGERDERPDARTRCRRPRARAGRCPCAPSRSRGSRSPRPGSRSRRATAPCRARRSARSRPAARPPGTAPPPAGAPPRSAADPAGRGPRRASDTANVCASAADGAAPPPPAHSTPEVRQTRREGTLNHRT